MTGHPFDKCSLVLGRGNGTFDPFVAVGTSSSQTATPVQVWDLNGDGHQDLVAKQEHGVSIRHGTGLGSFAGALVYYMGARVSNIAIRDLDLDGRLDMAAGGSLSDYATVRFGDNLGALNYYGVDREVIWVTPIAFDEGPSQDLAVLVTNGPKVMILAHPDAPSDATEPPPFDGSMPFALAANPARGVASFRMMRDLDGIASAGIVDVSGRRLAVWPAFIARAGASFERRGTDDRGRPAAAGRYFAVLEHDGDRWSIPFLWDP